MFKDLNGIWDLTFTNPADQRKIKTEIAVPSNIEPTLKDLGLLEDYLPVDSEKATLLSESVDDWCYERKFDAGNLKAGYTYNLVLEGIDTIADVFLNGKKILDAKNMHRTYKIDVSKALKKKGNKLKIIIRSSELWAREHLHDMFSTGHAEASYYDSQSHLRKARHQWGWDNAPRLITSGIYRSVYIEELPPVRFSEVYHYTVVLGENTVSLGTNFIFTTPDRYLDGYKVKIEYFDEDKRIYEVERNAYFIQGSIKYDIPNENVKLWWPSGFGEPNLYKVRTSLIKGDTVLDEREELFGIRKLYLERTENISETKEGEFAFYVNGERVFIRGTNWKPLDPLASIADIKTREGSALEEIKNLNCNMVRIWGGGIYEDEYFFDFCDKNGIMIWQDFMLACEIPPRDEAFLREVKEETREIIIKYRNHPSLAVWCGDNENDECMEWVNLNSTTLPSQSFVSRKTLKDAVLENDPYRTFVESSPYASDDNFKDRTKDKMTHFQPENHLYPDTTKFSEILRDCKSFFIGETGPIRVNAITANKEIWEREKMRAERLWDSPLLYSTNVHQHDGYFTNWRNAGSEVCNHYFKRDFAFSEFADYTVAINIICSEVFKDIIEYCRASRQTKTGVIWWSLQDMWPMLFNYSIIDSDGKRKLPYFWIRNSQKEVCLAAVRMETGGKMELYCLNDTLKNCTVKYSITAYDETLEGKEILNGEFESNKNSSKIIKKLSEPKKPSLLIIKWESDGETHINHTFTSWTDFEVMKKWVEIIGKECGFYSEINEFKKFC